jgi:hypothetical protein
VRADFAPLPLSWHSLGSTSPVQRNEFATVRRARIGC